MTPGPEADRVLLAHMRDCLQRIREDTGGDRARFETSRLVQDGTVRNLQLLAESSQRLSISIKDGEPTIRGGTSRGFETWSCTANVGLDIAAIWLVTEQDLPALADAVERMIARAGSLG